MFVAAVVRGAVPPTDPGLARIDGVAVGHAESEPPTSGVTVVRFDAPASVVVDVRGGASATFDTASLAVDATFGRRWALFIAGGSVFGLDAARGVRDAILESGGGHRVFGNPHRIAPVAGAALFDLPRSESRLPDYAVLGRAATERAVRRPFAPGARGAGAGATVGKYLGRGRAMRGGVGSGSGAVGDGLSVAVLVVVNAVGAVCDPRSGRWVAGARGPQDRIVPPTRFGGRRPAARGTTISVVVTNARLDRPGLARVAALVHTGLARAIVPYQTSTDGDVVFAASTAGPDTAPRDRWPGAAADRVGSAAGTAAVAAVLEAVCAGNRGSAGRPHPKS